MKRLMVVALAGSLVLFGCETEQMDGDEDAAIDDAGDAVDEPFEFDNRDQLTPFQDGVDSDYGHPDIERGTPGEDQVRLGRIQGEDTGFSGIWSHCRSGDFVLANSEIEVCIQEESTNRVETYTGGKLVDVRRQGQDDDQAMDLLMPLLIDLQTASAEKVEVVRDGSDGVAVLRVTGTEIDLAQLSGVTGNRFQDSTDLTVETEYRLEPSSSVVEMLTVVTPPGGSERTHSVGDWFAFGDRVEGWTPGEGFGGVSGQMPWLAGVGDGHSYALVFDDTAAPLGLADQFNVPYAEFRYDDITMTSRQPGTYRRWFVVGDGTLDSVRRLAAEVRGEQFVDDTATITVVDEGGQPVEGARLMISDDEPITFGHTDGDGQVELAVGPGSYQVEIDEVAGPARWDEPIEIGDDGEVTVVIPQLAEVAFQISEANSGDAISTRVTFEHPEMGRWFDYALQGSLETTVPAGEVTVMVTRGMEYDLYRQPYQFEPGEQYQESVELVRGVDTEGWRSGDFHQHLEPSLDSRLHVDARVKENVTEGVELAVPTDHDIVSDLRPSIEKLGLEEEISSFPGVEISPLYAHYNLYPVPYRPDERGRGSIPLAQRSDDGEFHLPRMPEIIETARQFDTDPIIQMNHPRRGSSGMMEYADFDPEADPEDNDHDDFTVDIDTIEVINSYGDVCAVLADWAGLLNAGRNVAGLGNSDTHHDNAEAGTPRNYMYLDAQPGDIEPDAVRDVLREGRVTVASHAFIELGEVLPGDQLEVDAGEPVEFDVSVQTPDWARAEQLFVIVNGEVVDTIDRTAADGERYDFQQTVQVEVDEDAWVVFWADGPRPTEPLPRTQQVIGFTNPVYLNTGGDWTAPGARPLDLDAIDTGYCG